jgi:very-short-patch-repair endonuclease
MADVGFVTVRQSRRRSTWLLRCGVPCAGVARTVVDIGSLFRGRDDVRALVSDSVQRRLTTVAELEQELAQAPRRGTLLVRTVLAEVGAGARSAGEAAFLELVRRAGLPDPELNVDVQTAGGRYCVDMLWRKYGVAVGIDGMEWHLNATSWRRDLIRQNHLHAAGFVVLRFPVTRRITDPDGVIAEIRATLEARGLRIP